MADPGSDHPLEVDVLIGSDYYWELSTGEVKRGATGPVAMGTRLGWVLSGPGPSIHTEIPIMSLTTTHTLTIGAGISSNSDLDNRLRSFWELESLGITRVDKSIHDTFKENVSFKNGKYEVSLPWKEFHDPLPDNYILSLRRLEGLTKRLRQTPEILREYNAIIQDQINRGVVEVVLDSEVAQEGRVHYLPHHAVIRNDKMTTKLRVVYNASARSVGPSLNDCLYTGPKFNQKIFDILIRFRSYRVALTADIEKAFLMISVRPSDRDVLRFLWYDDVQSGEPKIIVLRFTRVVFGVSSSPFLLNATVQHHLEKFSSVYPDLVSRILRSLYVDDLVCGASNEDGAHELFETAKGMLKSGSFNLRKFMTNSPQLQEVIDKVEGTQQCDDLEETYTKSTVGPQGAPQSGEQKILGVRWDVKSDCFTINFDEMASLASKTERLWIIQSQLQLASDGHFDEWRKQFDLFRDERGILRCGGRLTNSDLQYSTKHPIFLSKQTHLAMLIARKAHEKVLHNGVKDILTEIRTKYWIVKGRSLVRSVIHQCVVCRRYEGKPHHYPAPPPLPEFRVNEALPFSSTGVDFAGPLYIKTHGLVKSKKVWICLYTCCTMRAVSIDVVPDLSTNTFIRSLKRFCTRRGLPRLFVSDNGKTFKAASRVIENIINHEDVQQYLSLISVKWSFNLAKAPWWVGIFERLIRSTKRCLRKVIGRAKFSYDELLTAVIEIESVINS